MSLIQFVENYDDLSTDHGYQFKFYCDRCRNGYMSTFEPSLMGALGSAARVAGNIFGGIFSSAGSSSYEIQRAVGGKAHDDAIKKAVEEVRGKFHQCKRCGKWVCPDVCWNQSKMLCLDCAPDIQSELAHAQVEATVEQINSKVREQNMTKDLDLEADAVALCPKCGARTNGKFCAECGATLAPKSKCPKCAAEVKAGAKFCPECGGPLGKAKCPGCGKEFEKAPKFCDDCGTKM
jgi:membrane protease subunit (stomatin/prohibitin family)